MTMIRQVLLIVAACCGCAALACAQQPDALSGVPVLRAPAMDAVREQALAWLAEQGADADARVTGETIWQPDAGPYRALGVLDRLAATFALADTRAQALVTLCNQPRSEQLLAPQDWLRGEQTPAFERNNMRLFYGRWLSQQRLYDESLEQLTGIEPTDVVDPATLLFFQSVAYHRLLNKTDGLRTIDRLVSEVVDAPPRYVTVAGLMREDLKALEDDSLDHIARRMDDIRRRLDLGRAGEKVRKEEDGVIASLDKLIEDLEKQQQQQQQQGGGGGGAAPSSQPMPDSRIAGASGPGETNRKDLGRTAGWGDLPAKQREEALQQIGKDFPSHYRDIIEQYFRKLATEEEADR